MSEGIQNQSGRLRSGEHSIPASELAALRSFYEAWGHQAITMGGTVWFDGGTFSLMSVPSILLPDVSEHAVRDALVQTRRLAAVFQSVEPEGTSVPLFVLRDKTYGSNHLQRQFRQHVRTASLHLHSRECSWQEWQTAAVDCDRETLARRGKGEAVGHPLLTPQGRERIVAAASAVPHLGLHACFFGEHIVAYLVHITFGSTCEGLMAHRRHAPHESPARHASHLLFHSFARTAMARDVVHAVCVGRQSVPANPNLARFKLHAGFTAEPHPLRIRLHPWLAPWFGNPFATPLLRMIRSHGSGIIPALANLEVLERATLRGVPLKLPTHESGRPPSPPE